MELYDKIAFLIKNRIYDKEFLLNLIIEGHNKNILNDQNNDGQTLLMISIKNQDFWAAQTLLKYNVTANIKDNQGNTALHYIAQTIKLSHDEQKNKILEILLNNTDKEDVKTLNNDGKTSIQVAIESLKQDTLALIPILNHQDKTKDPLPFTHLWRLTFTKCAIKEIDLINKYEDLTGVHIDFEDF